MRRLYIRIAAEDIERLLKRARQQRRHPSDEAALLLAEALRADETADQERRDAVTV
jgi:hypothetical protein